MPAHARRTIRERRLRFFVVDAFAVAKKHAPTPELEVRMMGVAFIGAVCGHVDRVVADASEDVVLAKIRQQIGKKFGSKGQGVVESNMAVIREGLEATVRVDYDDPSFDRSRDETIVIEPDISISALMGRPCGTACDGGLFDGGYYDDVVASRFKDGTVGEAPVMPGTGLFMPPGCAAWKDKGLFRLTAPEFVASACTGCMECALVCPDAAVPNAVHEIHDLLLAAIATLDVTAAAGADVLRTHVFALATAVREAYRQLPSRDPAALHELVARAAETLDTGDVMVRRNLAKLAEALAVYPVAKTRPFFDAAEKALPGSGGLFAAAIDPWKCSGCLECIEVCGPGALVARKQDAAFSAQLERRFTFMSRLPNTPARFYERRHETRRRHQAAVCSTARATTR